ncbi:MAG: hypothetical protein AB1782_03385 [Cyanobacteriota bacterium]
MFQVIIKTKLTISLTIALIFLFIVFVFCNYTLADDNKKPQKHISINSVNLKTLREDEMEAVKNLKKTVEVLKSKYPGLMLKDKAWLGTLNASQHSVIQDQFLSTENYVVIASGDNKAKDIDLKVLDSKGKRLEFNVNKAKDAYVYIPKSNIYYPGEILKIIVYMHSTKQKPGVFALGVGFF